MKFVLGIHQFVEDYPIAAYQAVPGSIYYELACNGQFDDEPYWVWSDLFGEVEEVEFEV